VAVALAAPALQALAAAPPSAAPPPAAPPHADAEAEASAPVADAATDAAGGAGGMFALNPVVSRARGRQRERRFPSSGEAPNKHRRKDAP
jgi:hypothetical protein